MPPMRSLRDSTARAVIVTFAAASCLLVAASCSGGSTPPAPPPGNDPAPPPAVTAAVTSAPAKPKIDPKTTADCKVLLADITNEPPQGAVALNNAMTSKDAGATDRLEALTELVKSKRDGFRCCYDVWARDHTPVPGSVKMMLKLKSDGSLNAVEFEDTANRLADVEPCIAELAKSLQYPPSPSGKETKFRYPFDFKARR